MCCLEEKLQLNIYLNDVDSEKTEIPRVFKDKNVDAFAHFIINNNYRTDQSSG